MADTLITEPNADDTIREVYRTKMRAFESLDLQLDRRYMLVAIRLKGTATDDDYAATRAAIANLATVGTANIIARHKTRAAIPAGTALKMRIETGIVLEQTPLTPPAPPTP